MTFLAIEEPGISKYCENCNREFLNEHILQESGKLPELLLVTERERSLLHDHSTIEGDVGDGQQYENLQSVDNIGKVTESRPADTEGALQQLISVKSHSSQAPSLASMLFKEFEVCPYCQGKFIG